MSLYKPKNHDVEIKNIVNSTIGSISSRSIVDDVPPLRERVADKIKAYDKTEFIDDVYDFLVQYQNKTNEFKDFSFNARFVDQIPSNDESNSLRYNIEKREFAGGVNRAFKGAGGSTEGIVRDPRWVIRDVLEDDEHPGYKVLVYIKNFENTVNFTCWSKNYRDADRGADKIEELLDTYAHIFKAKGLDDIRFIERGRDIYKQRENFSWYGCPLKYLIKTQRVKVVYEKFIEELAVDIVTKI